MTLEKWMNTLQKLEVGKKSTLQEIIEEFAKAGYSFIGLMFREKKTGLFYCHKM